MYTCVFVHPPGIVITAAACPTMIRSVPGVVAVNGMFTVVLASPDGALYWPTLRTNVDAVGSTSVTNASLKYDV